MQLIEFSIVVLTLISKTCVSMKIFETTELDDNFKLVEAAIKVSSSCYGNQTSVFGIAGKSFGDLLKINWSERPHSVVLIGNATRAVINVPMREKLGHKLQLFIVTASSSTELLKILRQIKESHWWNHMAFFLIIDWSLGSKKGCTNAFQFLRTAWRANLLNSKYMCFNQTNGILIHGYNPFTIKAPESWQVVDTFTSKNDHPFTLLKREYLENDGLCDGLDFDETTDLGDYKIRATVKNAYSWNIDFSKTGIDSLGGLSGYSTRIIFQAIHANVKLHVYNKTDGPGLLDNRGRHVMMDVVDGNSDIVLNLQYQRNVQNFRFTTSFLHSGLSIMTQYNSDKSQLSKILAVIDINSRCGMLLVFVITFIFFKYFRSLETVSAILNLLRIICNSSLTKVPSNVPARIYLSALYIFMVTIQGLYQGKLSSLLTKAESLPNVNSLQDLADQGHKICAHKFYAYLFSDPSYKGRFIEIEDFDCTEFVLSDSSTACIDARASLVRNARKFKLHLSRDMFETMPVVYAIREDWPLERRFSMVIGSMVGAGIPERIHMGAVWRDHAIDQFYRELREREKFEVISLDQLTFAFAILGIGLGFATVVFTVEIAVQRIRTKIMKIRDKFGISLY